jgi:hypothetical protein
MIATSQIPFSTAEDAEDAEDLQENLCVLCVPDTADLRPSACP